MKELTRQENVQHVVETMFEIVKEHDHGFINRQHAASKDADLNPFVVALAVRKSFQDELLEQERKTGKATSPNYYVGESPEELRRQLTERFTQVRKEMPRPQALEAVQDRS